MYKLTIDNTNSTIKHIMDRQVHLIFQSPIWIHIIWYSMNDVISWKIIHTVDIMASGSLQK